jgi:hypothetical protein
MMMGNIASLAAVLIPMLRSKQIAKRAALLTTQYAFVMQDIMAMIILAGSARPALLMLLREMLAMVLLTQTEAPARATRAIMEVALSVRLAAAKIQMLTSKSPAPQAVRQTIQSANAIQTSMAMMFNALHVRLVMNMLQDRISALDRHQPTL